MTTKSYNLSDFNGKLLIASPAIGDIRFQKTVIYLCSDTKIDGVTGFVINQPLRYVSFRNILSQMKLKSHNCKALDADEKLQTWALIMDLSYGAFTS